jgi:hypothetical protein
MIDPAVMRRLHKVLALARHGAQGERDAAEHQLEVMLKKYGLTLADLESGTEKKRYEFKPKDKADYSLLRQILLMVHGGNGLKVFSSTASRTKIYVELTCAQHAEVVMTFAVMRAALKKELDLAFVAFIHANQLFDNAPREPMETIRTADEDAEDMRIMVRAALIQKTAVRKALTYP